jgi:hypothetical protein
LDIEVRKFVVRSGEVWRVGGELLIVVEKVLFPFGKNYEHHLEKHGRSNCEN